MDYDVIIAGASFAGLAVAKQLQGKILLIDRKNVGQAPTSACACPYEVAEEQRCQTAVLSTTSRLRFATPYGKIEYELTRPWCVFDYHAFCQNLLSHTEVDFVKANILDLQETAVITDKGSFEAPVLVDATGWRAKLASSLDRSFLTQSQLGFGIETEAEGEKQDCLYFLFDPKIIKGGYAWIFPAGRYSRVGVGSYVGQTDLKSNLERFAQMNSYEIKGINGGFMPHSLRKPVVKNIFVVGDAAGQLVPITGEGIRQALYFGKKCGQIIQTVLNKETSLEDGLKSYQAFVNKHRRFYTAFSWLQSVWAYGPTFLIEIAARTLGKDMIRPSLLRGYQKVFDEKNL